MACSCRKSYCPECLEGWTPPAPPEVGSEQWKNQQAFQWVLDKFGGLPRESCVIALPCDWGFFAIRYNSSSGWDYYRVSEIKKLH